MKDSNNYDINENLFIRCPNDSIHKYYKYNGGVMTITNVSGDTLNNIVLNNRINMVGKGIELYFFLYYLDLKLLVLL